MSVRVRNAFWELQAIFRRCWNDILFPRHSHSDSCNALGDTHNMKYLAVALFITLLAVVVTAHCPDGLHKVNV